MKKECEQLFIDLVSPYLTAVEARRNFKKDDWHGVFAFAETLDELLGSIGFSKVPDECLLTFGGNINLIRAKAKMLSDIAVNQESRSLHDADLSSTLTNDAMDLIGDIQGKLREVIIDNVCACESGPKVRHYEVGVFPKQDKTLLTLRDLAGGYVIKQVHDDGDLTVEANETMYVVTTDGKFFEDQKTCHGK